MADSLLGSTITIRKDDVVTTPSVNASQNDGGGGIQPICHDMDQIYGSNQFVLSKIRASDNSLAT